MGTNFNVKSNFIIEIITFPFFLIFLFSSSYTHFSKVSIFCLSRAIIRLRAM
jgi:hypothetical protein